MWLAGVSSLVAAERRAGKALWEWWLDALSFRADSAGRLTSVNSSATRTPPPSFATSLSTSTRAAKARWTPNPSCVSATEYKAPCVSSWTRTDARDATHPGRSTFPLPLPPSTTSSSKISTPSSPRASSRPHRVPLPRQTRARASHRQGARASSRPAHGSTRNARAHRRRRRRSRRRDGRAGVSSAHSRAQHRAGSGGIQTGRHSGVAGTGRRSMRRHARRQTRRARVVGG